MTSLVDMGRGAPHPMSTNLTAYEWRGRNHTLTLILYRLYIPGEIKNEYEKDTLRFSGHLLNNPRVRNPIHIPLQSHRSWNRHGGLGDIVPPGFYSGYRFIIRK